MKKHGEGQVRIYGPNPKDMQAIAEKAARGADAKSNIGFADVRAGQFIRVDIEPDDAHITDFRWRAIAPNKDTSDAYLQWHPNCAVST